MAGLIGLAFIVVISFIVGGPLGFLVLGSCIGLAIKSLSKPKRRR